ncbi:MAG: hypothetical protein OER90_04360 [Gemmatimonadota bacterium]|nr:hypothetical protein [Gemmatimonadota bacterium]
MSAIAEITGHSASYRPFRDRRAPHVIVALLLAAALGCTGPHTRDEERTVPSRTIEEVLAAHADSLMALPGVIGTALGQCDGDLCIRVFVTDSSETVRRRIPDQLDGYPVRVEVTGPFRPRRDSA